MTEGFTPTAEQQAAFEATATHFSRKMAVKAALGAGLEDGTFVVKPFPPKNNFGWYVLEGEAPAVEKPAEPIVAEATEACAPSFDEEAADAVYQAELDARLQAKHGGTPAAVVASETLTPTALVEEAHEAVALADEAGENDTLVLVEATPAIDGALEAPAIDGAADDGEEPIPTWVKDLPTKPEPVAPEPAPEPEAPSSFTYAGYEASNIARHRADSDVFGPGSHTATLTVVVAPSPAPGALWVVEFGSGAPDVVRGLADKAAIRYGEKITTRDAFTFKPIETVEFVKVVTKHAA